MLSFIENIISQVFEKHSAEETDKLCFVFPNRRAGLYLKKYIAQKIKKTIWSPSVFSIEDFACHITGFEIADQTTLLFDFYSIYKKAEGTKAQAFDEFINWAQILINDYNDSDINLADTEHLFQYLNEAKSISLWNPDNTPLTDHEKNYLNFYNSLSRYYKDFTKLLIDKKIGYQGLINKKAAEQVEKYCISSQYFKIIFAGFNALTKSEEKIIKTLINSGKAEIYLDADNYYIKNEIHEAGTFIRKYIKEWDLTEFNRLENCFKEDTKNISITGVPLQMGQAELAGQLLSEMNDNNANSENTALVLADEKMLIPVLFSIPENVKDVNITMGYPLSFSSVHSLFMNIFILYENSGKYSSPKTIRFYQKDIINFFNHPFLRMQGATDKKALIPTAIIDKIKKTNRVFFINEEIVSLLKDNFLCSLFKINRDNPIELLQVFTSLIEFIRDTIINGKRNENIDTGINIEFLFNYAVIITKIRNLINEYGFIKDIKTLRKIFSGLADITTIPFYGEPLKGMQIMGMLETRTLDFENIILLSVNEGILPAGKFQNTFVPYDIRKEMGLSTYRQKESIFAYHFYRLLQRAKNIHIIYNTQPGNFAGGEKSRFISQICEELPKYNNKIKIQQKLLVNEPTLVQEKDEISIIKSKEIINSLKHIAVKGFSPSALNTYISCPLKFYFQYIEKIEETKETAETIDAATLGSVVHFILYELYKDFKGKTLNCDDIKRMFKHVEPLAIKGFAEYYPEGDMDAGKNLLIAKVVCKFVNNFLKSEISFIEELKKINQTLTIIRLEEPVETTFELNLTKGETIPVKIKGYIDRVDLTEETLRIIDYKTGIVKKEELKFESWEELTVNPGLSKSLQLLTYAYLLSKIYFSENVKAGIISFRSLSKGFLPVNAPDSENDQIDSIITSKVQETISQIISLIFKQDIPFSQTDEIIICRNCPFADICN